jgi:hypothetical protein
MVYESILGMGFVRKTLGLCLKIWLGNFGQDFEGGEGLRVIDELRRFISQEAESEAKQIKRE